MELRRPRYFNNCRYMIPEDTKNEMAIPKSDNFVTVVAVGTSEQELNKENINFDSNSPGYVTVLTIGDTENNKVLKDVTEEVIVYRLPGERLGFGLKFEGGTKASEFVKRLFIQSCAADSPASRVKSSWGKLAEGDEVVEIDSIPVNTMTRIDCVRCLKDSNVAIKLLVRHIYDQTPKHKSEETLPTTLDGRRTPPPPPPVPPRKVPRKLLKNINANVPRDPPDNTVENCVLATRQTETHKPKKLQSPRNSTGPYSSPDVSRRDRRFSDGSLGPPDAEVYVDLFLQESTQSLSESDDTGSTISTVIDRFGSFPTTTTSSFSGSLPSTPTSIQRQLDISNINIYDDEEYLMPSKNFSKPSIPPREENNNIILDEPNPLCFQDAPLSYGNESTKIIIPEDDDVNEDPILREESKQFMKKPPVPPRSRDTTLSSEKIDEKRNNENLPRLVDFVPKSCNGMKEINESSAEIMKLFLENERYKADFPDYDAHETDNLDTYTNGIDLYSSKWSLSSQLATIGEVEEEGSSDFSFTRPGAKSPPVVIVENIDSNEENEKVHHNPDPVDKSEPDGIMAALPTDPRQPPDGHEFPDFIEHHNDSSKQKYFKETESSPTVLSEKVPDTSQKNTTESFSNPSNLILCQPVSSSNTELRSIMYDSTEDLKHESIPPPAPLHTRSQSLIDMSALTKQKNARWNQLFEQRRKGLSKLKGLVIPEASETDITPCVNIPEIKSQNTQILPLVPKVYSNFNISDSLSKNTTEFVKSSIAILPWSSNSTSNLPKYSPAFKRKSLQVYATSFSKDENSECLTKQEFPKYCDKPSSKTNKLNDDDLNPPKSLESISSPTRSDCSFDYVSSSRKYVRDSNESLQKSHTNKLEDESDNDSAVSSSQSSYNSRYSPPPSPTRSCDLNPYGKKLDDDEKNAQNRLLKPSSVEAINRKNILASAKCRSGKDLKIGSPVIRRKQEETSERTDGDGLKNEKTLETVENETSIWESVSPIVDEEIAVEKEEVVLKEEVKVKEVEKTVPIPTNIVSVRNPPPKPLPRSTSLSTLSPPLSYTKRVLEDTKENRSSRNFYSSHRKSAPINVKALMENFENFGSSPPPMPQKVPVYKPQKPTRNVKLEIIKRENEVVPKNSKDELSVNESEKLDVAPSRVIKPRRLSLDKPEKMVERSSKSKPTTIILKSEFVGSSLGITLSGGTDENREITVHRIRYGSIAYHDGRLKRGDKIISVNGNLTKGLTHSEAVELLKEPVTEFSLVIEEGTEVVPSPTISSTLQKRSSSMSVLTDIRPPSVEVIEKKANHTISIMKDGSGLGFSIEGGKDSPLGDVPLVVKKIFTGGPADKSGQLKVGDEVLQINDMKFTNLSRIDAWNSMKKIEDGQVIIHIYR